MKMTSDFYTAPEITQDLSQASAQSDIYSLGCILHDFIGTSSRVPCNEIRESGPYAAILLSCTRKDPSRRFKTVGDVREALLEVATTVATPTSVGASTLQALLAANTPMAEPDWSHLADFLEDNAGSTDSQTLLQTISHGRITELLGLSAPLIKRIGLCYAEWIRNGSFVFANCDVSGKPATL